MAIFNRNKNNMDDETYIMGSSSEYKPGLFSNTKLMQIIVICFMAFILIVGIFIISDRLIQQRKNQQIIETIESFAEMEVPAVEEDTEIEEQEVYVAESEAAEEYTVLFKYNSFLETYPELSGWIIIEGANVNYPVVQSRDFSNPHFYLDKGPDRQPSDSGAIFLDTRNVITELDRHTVIYGHNMANGTMFGSLDKYKNNIFRNNNSIVTFNTLYKDYKWEIINVFRTTTDFYYIQTYFEDDEDFLKLMNQCLSLSLYENDVVISPADKILTLSTCTNDINDGRFVVQARLIESGDDVNKN